MDINEGGEVREEERAHDAASGKKTASSCHKFGFL